MDLARSELQLESIVSRIAKGDLDLQPDFQRGEIWDKKRQQRLVDSLLREWYVPAVHIVKSLDGGPDTVLDGQQRLAAIRDFFNNGFPVDGKIEPHDPEIRALDGMRFANLPPLTRRALESFPLPLVTLKRYRPDEPNELFFRLNQSYNLTPSEKRNALYGPARGQVRTAVDELAEVGLLSQAAIGFSNARLAYDDIIARCFVAIERGDLRQHINNNVVEAYYRESSFSPETLEAVTAAGTRLMFMIDASGLRLRFNKATLFSWLIFCHWITEVKRPLPVQFLKEFEEARKAVKSGDYTFGASRQRGLISAAALYDDRASYRVTDVSSVLARDCVLYLYLEMLHDFPSRLGSTDLLAQLNSSTESQGAQGEQVILRFVEDSGWGPFGTGSRAK